MQSADRALAILGAFTESRPELGVTELARELGMHKSTVSRLLSTLEGRGLVRREGDRFLPGPELARLGSLAARGLELLPTARPFLVELAEQTGETVNLAVPEDGRALNVEQVESAHFVGATNWRGRTTPLHATANGKAMLAFGACDRPGRLEAMTERTIVKPAELGEELGRARRVGYAVAVEELEPGLNSVGAPVFDASGACVGAISVSGPSYRVSERRLPELGRACAATAAAISTALGHRRAA
ncbi:MAG TPA: IclR family transcriptional regulator [Gaiellaceae bacterium]|jgi:DNA-binding IclR family transcriptional regulator